MNAEARELLEAVGGRLDQGKYPLIHNRGMIRPSTSTVAIDPLGEETCNVPSRARRSATGSWQRAAGRQRPSNRPRPSGRTAPVIDTVLSQRYREELDAVQKAYPGAEFWHQDEGMWLRTESLLIAGLEKTATFLTAIPFVHGMTAKSWAFWNTPIYFNWIGPRHTNFPDGSVCAFEPKDKSWNIGDSLVKLLDLYSLWAFRHLHLEVIGRWPGHQSVPCPYERLQELKDNEHCGCDRPQNLYGDCCKPRDLQRDTFEELWKFIRIFGGGTRRPPGWVQPVLAGREEPPPATDISHFLSFGTNSLAKKLRESTAVQAFRTDQFWGSGHNYSIKRAARLNSASASL